ncbi:YidC/Oxa1 family membrane protein insertase [Patescibacteria group bacterium]|nr:YidC/Oxa1 family membrane protein insertase [Patescibacteria group bacterium]MBU1705255.1 YidC/Oxa1 family membrane protein insertase [Patescibacteria group bacterium]
MDLFHTYLYQPIFNLLIWLYNVIPGADLGFAIIALTVVIKTLLWPLSHASLKSQKRMQDLQPKLDEIKKQYKDDKEGMSKAMMELYSSEKVNPLGSCLPLLIQLPIIIALFRVLRDGVVTSEMLSSTLYPFVQNPETVNHIFLGIQDLSEKSLILAVLAGIFQFIQTKMLMARRPPKDLRKQEGAKDESMMAAMNKSMLYFMPIVTVVIGASFPSGLTLYWVTMNVVTILQQLVAFRKKPDEAEVDSAGIVRNDEMGVGNPAEPDQAMPGNGTQVTDDELGIGNSATEAVDAEFTENPGEAGSGSAGKD